MDIPSDEIEIPEIRTQTKSKNNFLVPFIGGIIILGAGSWFFFGPKISFPTKSSDQTTNAVAGEDVAYRDFAENVVMTLRNISYTNIQQSRKDLDNLLSDELLSSYQHYYSDPKFIQMYMERKLWISFGEVDRSTIESGTGNIRIVKVIGVCTYTSDLSKTSSQYPFTYLVKVENQNGKFICTKIERI